MLIAAEEGLYKHKKVLIKCDFEISDKCKKIYYKIYKHVLECRKNNDGKDRCIFCFNSATKIGVNNYNFKYPKNERYFENIDTDLKAYLLGWIAGDGNLRKDGIRLAVHWADKEILDLFVREISPGKPIKFRKYDNTVNLLINSVKLMKDVACHLELKGPGKKSDKIKLPSLFSDELKWSFIRGLFDSDGSVHSIFSKTTRPIASICSTSVQMREDIRKICDDEKIKYRESNFDIIFSGNNCLKFLGKIYNSADYFLLRKKIGYDLWKSWIPRRGTKFKPAKIRIYVYHPMSEAQKESIRASNRKRKGMKYSKRKDL